MSSWKSEHSTVPRAHRCLVWRGRLEAGVPGRRLPAALVCYSTRNSTRRRIRHACKRPHNRAPSPDSQPDARPHSNDPPHRATDAVSRCHLSHDATAYSRESRTIQMEAVTRGVPILQRVPVGLLKAYLEERAPRAVANPPADSRCPGRAATQIWCSLPFRTPRGASCHQKA